MSIPDATSYSLGAGVMPEPFRSIERRVADLEHDNNVLRSQIVDVLTAVSIMRRENEQMTERNIKLVKRVTEFLDRWSVA
jgi:phage shock protein A